MWKHALLVIACCLLPSLALANGYDTYACPLAWSPDSARLAAIVSQDWPYHSETAQGELLLCDRYGHGAALTDGALASPCFSPDSAWLAVVLNGDLVAFNLADGTAAWLTVRGDVLDCCFAPLVDGAGPPRIIFSAGARFYGSEIYSMPFTPGQDGQPELATNTGSEISCFGPAPSPDGERFVFLHQYGCDSPPDQAAYERLYFLSGGEQPEQQLTLPQHRDEDYHESNVAWLDASTIVFQRGGWGDWRLMRKDLATGAEVIMLTYAQQPSLSRDGQWLACTRRDARVQDALALGEEAPPSVWLMRVGYRRLEQVSPKGVAAAHPALSPDGARLAWLEDDGRAVSVHAIRVPAGGRS
jgi:hypothetical protein